MDVWQGYENTTGSNLINVTVAVLGFSTRSATLSQPIFIQPSFILPENQEFFWYFQGVLNDSIGRNGLMIIPNVNATLSNFFPIHL